MSKLKIAIQKSGRLNRDSMQLLSDCGIRIDNSKDQLRASSENFPLEVYFLRNSDIPTYVQKGLVDIGIVGENLLFENDETEVRILRKLGFSKCRLSIAVPKGNSSTGLEELNGKSIATSHPKTLSRFLKANEINATIQVISGSVEVAPKIGVADAICDLVSSGSTLFKNELMETERVATSEACLIGGANVNSLKAEILTKLTLRIESVLKARNLKYIMMNVANENIPKVTSLLPVLKSPTITPLGMEGWSSLQTVIQEDRFWEVIEQLKDAGAEGIIVTKIEKIID